MLTYQIEPTISAEEFKDLLIQSTLSERCPIEDYNRIKAMVENANIIITAREKGELIGVARSVSDFVYCTYLSDLSVAVKYQKQGIGKALIKETKLAAPQATIILLAAPKAIGYYPHIGMAQHYGCYILSNENQLK